MCQRGDGTMPRRRSSGQVACLPKQSGPQVALAWRHLPTKRPGRSAGGEEATALVAGSLSMSGAGAGYGLAGAGPALWATAP